MISWDYLQDGIGGAGFETRLTDRLEGQAGRAVFREVSSSSADGKMDEEVDQLCCQLNPLR